MLIKRRKFWLVSLFIIVLSGLGVYRFFKYPFIKRQVNNLVATESDSLYKIQYDSLVLDELEGSLYVNNLSVTGDTLLQNRYVTTGDTLAASMLINALVPRIEVIGFKTAKALIGKELSCNKILILRPKITINAYPGQSRSKAITTEGEALYKRILGRFTQIQADTISIIGAEIVVRNAYSGEIKLLTFNTSLVLSGVLIDSLHYYDTSRTLFSKHLGFQTDKVVVGDKPTLAEATLVTFDTKQQVLGIAAIKHDGLKSGKKVSASAKNVIVSGLQVKGAIDALQVSIDKAGMQGLDVMIKKGETSEKTKSRASPILTGWLKSFSINSFAAGDVGIDLSPGKKTADDLLVKNSAINITRFGIDTTALMDESLLDRAENVIVTNQLISVTSKDRLYKYNISGLRLNTRNRSLGFKEIAVVPQLSETAFANKAGVQKDRYDARLKNLVITGIDFKKMFDGDIVVDGISTTNSIVNIYRNIGKKSDGISKVGKFPHQMIAKIKKQVTIKAIALKNTRIAYKEKNPLSDTSGTLIFENANIAISNITNRVKASSNITALKGTLQLLGSVPLDVNIKFYLDQIKEGGYSVSVSSTKAYNGAILNPLTIPMALLRIDGGTINGLSFDMTGDNNIARGNFTVEYSNLKVSVMARDKKSGNLDKKGIKSLLANVVVKNSNPKNGKLRTANVVYQRDPYKSFFNMIWKFVFTGLKDVMGP